jgi:hypothetical protein
MSVIFGKENALRRILGKVGTTKHSSAADFGLVKAIRKIIVSLILRIST